MGKSEEQLNHEMNLIKQGLETVPRFELIKLILFIYFSQPTSLNELINLRSATVQKIGDMIKKYIK